jgi:hypothetical protein
VFPRLWVAVCETSTRRGVLGSLPLTLRLVQSGRGLGPQGYFVSDSTTMLPLTFTTQPQSDSSPAREATRAVSVSVKGRGLRTCGVLVASPACAIEDAALNTQDCRRDRDPPIAVPHLLTLYTIALSFHSSLAGRRRTL